MAAGRIVLASRMPAIDLNGVPIGGARLYLHVNRSTTLAPIYANEGLTVPRTNPAVADAGGRFPDMWAEAGTEAVPVLYSLQLTDREGAPVASPSTFDDYRPSVDYDTATVALAENAQISAELYAGLAQQAYEDSLALQAGDATPVSNRAKVDGSNIPSPSTFRNAIGAKTATDVPMSYIGLDAVASLNLGIDYVIKDDASDPEHTVLWFPTTYIGYAMSKQWTAANTPGAGEAPAFTFCALAENYGSAKDVGAILGLSIAYQSGGVCFAGNFIAGGAAGADNCRYVIIEGDMQPADGMSIQAGSIGLPLNIFNSAGGTAIQFGAIGDDASWNDGIIVYGVSGSALAGGSGATMNSLVNSGGATYDNNAPIKMSPGHRIQFTGPSATHNYIGGDTGGALRIVLGAGPIAIRNSTDVNTIVGITGNGNTAIGANASTASGYKLDVASDLETQGIGIARARSANFTALETFVSLGAAGNAAGCAARVGTNNSTGRSINAGGTVNTAGADYAEYERQSEAMLSAGRSFAKGDIVGFDLDGRLTDRFAEAISFAVKSTNPSFVGGDDFSKIPATPPMPEFEEPAYEGAPDPGAHYGEPKVSPRWGELRMLLKTAEAGLASEIQGVPGGSDAAAAIIAKWHDAAWQAHQAEYQALEAVHSAEHVRLKDAWDAAKAQREVDLAEHAAAVERARERFNNETVPAWQAEFAENEAALNEERKPFDRIAYAGKVPVNVSGALPGDYLVPMETNSGGITARVVQANDLTFTQSLTRIGLVHSILADGRPLVIVHVG